MPALTADAPHRHISFADATANQAASTQLHSILFLTAMSEDELERATAPDCFRDLLVDQVISAITRDREQYNLAPYFYVPLATPAEIQYRHAVFHDLKAAPLRAAVEAFGIAMTNVRARIDTISRLYYERQKQLWFLDAVETYRSAVTRLAADLHALKPSSSALRDLHSYLDSYIQSKTFTTLTGDAHRLREAFIDLEYSVHLEGRRIVVMAAEPVPDYRVEVAALFQTFRQGDSAPYTFRYRRTNEMNHIEASIIDMVAQLHPETFAALASFFQTHPEFVDRTLTRFDREAQFYLAVLEYEDRNHRAGLPFCYPVISTENKTEAVRGAYDLTLAESLRPLGTQPVLNSFYLAGPERILIVSGPNQGGKTTFARMVGQLHYMAALGCPVAAAGARLFLCDQVLTHFERTDDLATLRSTFEDELARMHAILRTATSSTLVIMNESFHSTRVDDALFINKELLKKVQVRDMLCVAVTFLDELALMGDSVVSMVATVELLEPAHRTFRIVRKPADGLAYAMALARKYGLTSRQIKQRLAGRARKDELR